jgi:3-oxoadipate enol-lactonase
MLAADVARLMDALDIAAAHVVGWSLGGLVGQQLAIDFPGRMRRLVLVNTFARLWPTSPHDALTLTRRLIVSTLLPMAATAHVVANDLFPRSDQAELRRAVLARIGINDAESYRHLIGAIRRFDSRRQLHRIQAPTLVITGERDVVVPRGCQQQLVSGIPKVKWQIVRGSGHATPIDQPNEFNRLVLDFLQR